MVKPMKAALIKARRLEREHIKAGDEHSLCVRSVLRSTFPSAGTLAGSDLRPREFHPVVHLRTAYGNARLVRPVRTSRTLRSVAVGSGVFAQRRTTALEVLRTRQSLRRA